MSGGELVPFRPSRVVTGWTDQWYSLRTLGAVGWWLTQRADGTLGFTNQNLYGHGEVLTLAEIHEVGLFGRVRPVELPLPHELEVIRAALRGAGSKAVTTLALALSRCAEMVGLSALVAGRPSSWESQALMAFAQWGARVDVQRTDVPAGGVLLGQILDWVAGPYRYVELAATLAGLVAEVSDEHLDAWTDSLTEQAVDASAACALAWTSIADRELWPDTYEGATVGEQWYLFLMSGAVAFSPEWFTQWGAEDQARWRQVSR